MINVFGWENDAANSMDAGIKSRSCGAEKGAKFDSGKKKKTLKDLKSKKRLLYLSMQKQSNVRHRFISHSYLLFSFHPIYPLTSCLV